MAKRGEVEGKKCMDGMSAHGIDMVMTKKSNLEVVLPEKWACLVSPASHFSRFSPTVLRIEPIGFQQNLCIEHDYQTTTSNLDFSFFFENSGENYLKNCFQTIPKKLNLQQTGRYV